MEYDWDDGNIAHIARHGVRCDEAEQVIENDPLDIELQLVNREQRTLHLGETSLGRVLYVVATMRKEKIRVISAFPADRKGRRFYADQKAKDGQTNRHP